MGFSRTLLFAVGSLASLVAAARGSGTDPRTVGWDGAARYEPSRPIGYEERIRFEPTRPGGPSAAGRHAPTRPAGGARFEPTRPARSPELSSNRNYGKWDSAVAKKLDKRKPGMAAIAGKVVSKPLKFVFKQGKKAVGKAVRKGAKKAAVRQLTGQ